MALTSVHGKFHHPGVSRLDYKTLHMDRVLTAFLARLWHRGLPSKLSRAGDLAVDDFVTRMCSRDSIGTRRRAGRARI
jgi:hypothetical protein